MEYTKKDIDLIEQVMRKPVFLSALLNDITGMNKEKNYEILRHLSENRETKRGLSLLHRMAEQGELKWVVPAVEQHHLTDLLTLKDSQGKTVFGTLAENHPENIFGMLLAVSKEDLSELLLLRNAGKSVFEILLEKRPEDMERALLNVPQEKMLDLLLSKNNQGKLAFETLIENQRQRRKISAQISISITQESSTL